MGSFLDLGLRLARGMDERFFFFWRVRPMTMRASSLKKYVVKNALPEELRDLFFKQHLTEGPGRER